MFRGISTFKCTKCGERFKAFDIEYNVSPLSCPQPCPHCGSVRTFPCHSRLFYFLDDPTPYEPLWQTLENSK